MQALFEKLKEQVFNRGAWRKRMLITLLSLAVFVTVLPEAVRWGLIYWLPSTGVGQLAIKDMDVNLFSGRLSLREASVQRDDSPKFSIDTVVVNFSWLKLFSGVIHLEEVQLQGARLGIFQKDNGELEIIVPLTQGQAQTSGVVNEEDSEVAGEPATLPKISVAAFQLLDAELTLYTQAAKGVLYLEDLSIAHASTWLNESIVLSVDGSWNQAPVDMHIEVSPWDKQPSLSAQLNLQGVNLAGITALPEEPLKGAVDLDLNVQGEWDWQGNIQLGVQTQLGLQNFMTEYKSIRLDLDGLGWQGEIMFGLQQQALTYQVQGNLNSNGLMITDTRQQLALLAWQVLTLDSLSLDQNNNVRFDQLHAEQLYSLSREEDDRGRFYAAAVDIDQWDLQEGKHLQIAKSQVTDAHYQLTVTEQGELQVQTMLGPVLAGLTDQAEDDVAEERPSEPQGTTESVAEEKTFTLAVGEASLGGTSQLYFTDQRFAVPVKEFIKLNHVSVTGLDQRYPDKPAQLSVLGSLGDFSKIKIDGEIKPFAEQVGLALSGDIKAVPLPSVSPYSEAYIGYHLTRGQYDHDFDLKIDNNDIEFNNKLLLRQLQLKSVDPSKPQPMAQQLDVPLSFALNMLRDGDDNIQLEVPIKGRLDDPNINVSSVINKALANALKSGATNYLTYALQPYGAVLMAANMVGDKLSSISLDPIEYPAGQAGLSSEQQAYLGKVSDLLASRPKLNLTACASSNDEDRQALQSFNPKVPVQEAVLVELASQRSIQVKQALLEQGIESGRVFLCQPEFKNNSIRGVSMAM
ncbi:hypothetical protein R50073_44520 [Maricurvus nonylphenolicus]|uniref:DUF748 domain-containing protein n=1 Tax=Maricurvus nonylphenolicus TaxID=1008307 RepID=UPI0036F1A84C